MSSQNSSTDPSIVFVGLGVMGTPIAHLIRDQMEVVAVDLSESARQAAEERGLVTTEHLAETLPTASHVCLMLPSIQASNVVVDDILKHANNQLTVIEMGTVGPKVSRHNAHRLQEAGHLAVDAPVIGGGRAAAESGRLTTLIGGDDEAVSAAMPVLKAMSQKQLRLGTAGAGQTMKLVHNALLASLAASTAEALAVSRRLGVDQKVALEILSSSSTRSYVMDWLFAPALNGEYSSGASIAILGKDLKLANETWDEVEAQMPVNKAAAELYLDRLNEGLGNHDISSILKILENAQ